MSKLNLIDEIVLEKNKLSNNLTDDEKREVDIYLEEILKELSPAIDVINNIFVNEEKRKNIADSFKLEIEEQKWLEKLSKTFYDQADIQDPMKIQKE